MEAAKTVRIEREPQSIRRVYRLRGLLVGCIVAVLSGCSLLPGDLPSEPLGEIVPAQRELLPEVPTRPAPEAPIKETNDAIAVVVSGNLPAYLDVAERLVEHLGTDAYFVHVLEGESPSAEVSGAAAIFDRDLQAVVAVGLPAALFAAEFVDAPLIFCQVFNYSDYPELTKAAAGVSMLAAFDEQLAFWKAMDPSLGSIGTIVGPGHEKLIAEVDAAAAAQGIALRTRVSSSDRETVYQFRRMSAEVDGFWLVPDNRILSISAIEEMMSYASARRLPVVVSTPELLRYGALMSLSPSPSHVADSVLSVLASLQRFITGGFEIVNPREFDVDVNPSVAARLGIGSF